LPGMLPLLLSTSITESQEKKEGSLLSFSARLHLRPQDMFYCTIVFFPYRRR
jgi:hypothetical protein